jgi:hypothetical protein
MPLKTILFSIFKIFILFIVYSLSPLANQSNASSNNIPVLTFHSVNSEEVNSSKYNIAISKFEFGKILDRLKKD